MMKRQEIWFVQLQTSQDDVVGHEQSDNRPCLVIRHNKQVSLSTIVPISTTANLSRFPFTYEISKSSQNGLNYDSTALIFQIRSLNDQRFLRKFGVLENPYFSDILELVRDYLGLS
jgi:mRNA interferase MazF